MSDINTQELTHEILLKSGALKRGHFRLTSGLHSDFYIQCAALFERPAESELLCKKLAEKVLNDELNQNKKNKKIDVVAGPALGGIIMAYEIARALNARNIFAEREDGKMTLRRGFQVNSGERVFIVEDVVTTGGSVKEVIDIVKSAGAEVVGVGAIADRSSGKANFGVPFYSLIALDTNKWTEDECPLCKKGEPIVKPGSRKI